MKRPWLSAALTASAIALAVFSVGHAGVVQGAKPDGNENKGVCQPQDAHIKPEGDKKSVTVTAPEGKVITGYCVKAGSIKKDDGPKYTHGLTSESVEISHPSGKDISHYVVFYTDKPPTTTTTVPPATTTTVPPTTTTVPPTTTTTTVPPTTTTTTVPPTTTTTTVPPTTTTIGPVTDGELPDQTSILPATPAFNVDQPESAGSANLLPATEAETATPGLLVRPYSVGTVLRAL